jgi:hypothetical protein
VTVDQLSVVVYHRTGSGCVTSHWLWVGGITLALGVWHRTGSGRVSSHWFWVTVGQLSVVVYHRTGSGCVASTHRNGSGCVSSHWLWVSSIALALGGWHRTTRIPFSQTPGESGSGFDDSESGTRPGPSGRDTGIPSGQGRVGPLCEVVSKRFACEAFKRAVIDGVAIGASLKLV